MSIAEFIRDTVLRPRLKRTGCLVVYDADRRYREQCLELATDKVRVVDASESSIESREAALFALCKVGEPKTRLEGVLIYVPAKRPVTDEQKQSDPFALYAECGAVFPEGDGDEYQSICLRAKPDYATEIRKVFTSSPSGPAFAVIDAIGDGLNWPQLSAMLKVESALEILTALMAPSATQAKALKDQQGWEQEARAFLGSTLSMKVLTRAKTWSTLAEELWRYVLFSEFAFDLPVGLPESLSVVPRAPKEAQPIIDGVCDGLRGNNSSREIYIERAEAIEADLKLRERCKGIEDLGERDTFAFEERTFLRTAIKGILKGNTDATRQLLSRHKNSVWMGIGESQAQWELVSSGLNLTQACGDFESQLVQNAQTQSDLIDFYLRSLREVDRLQREFEQVAGDLIEQQELLDELVERARRCYRSLSEKVQSLFIKRLEASGWPPEGRLANADVFDRFVAHWLKESGTKVAYLMVDALRYELGVALEKLLAEDGPVQLHAAFAQLPTITPVGMASLLPGARKGLTLSLENETLTPKMDGESIATVAQRMKYLSKRYGDRFKEMTLLDFVKTKTKNLKIAKTVDLLALRSTEIDSQLESNPETALALIPTTLKHIRKALDMLRDLGFKHAVIATDHGFFLNLQSEPGDVCSKPLGNWPVTAHERLKLGEGNPDSHNAVISAEKLGIHGDFSKAALPRSMAPYQAGYLYFHGGASLSEAVVPVLAAQLAPLIKPELSKVVKISYRNGAKSITTRVPVIEAVWVTDGIFDHGSSIEILLEAQDLLGNVIGEPRPGGDVNPATRAVTLIANQRKSITLTMQDDFRGQFKVLALHPNNLTAYSTIELETNYME